VAKNKHLNSNRILIWVSKSYCDTFLVVQFFFPNRSSSGGGECVLVNNARVKTRGSFPADLEKLWMRTLLMVYPSFCFSAFFLLVHLYELQHTNVFTGLSK